jgi:hypothetical protein
MYIDMHVSYVANAKLEQRVSEQEVRAMGTKINSRTISANRCMKQWYWLSGGKRVCNKGYNVVKAGGTAFSSGGSIVRSSLKPFQTHSLSAMTTKTKKTKGLGLGLGGLVGNHD